MVRPRQIERVVAAHAVPTRQDIDFRVIEHVPDVLRARNVRWGNHDREDRPRRLGIWVKEALFRAYVKQKAAYYLSERLESSIAGSLPIGHMLDHTEIDILTRWHRMRGYNTLFLPGTDHAGISTQRVVVKLLAEQGIDYRKLGREAFEKKVWEWKEQSGGTITKQRSEER